MCGIMGYIGREDAVPVILDGLRRLEYRGYDSAGVAVLTEGGIWCEKKKGRLKELEEVVEEHPFSQVGIGHTRWATHGVPSDVNAHPHLDCKGRLAVVHNGIIENYTALRAQLKGKGHRFVSETDTEVLAHLIEELYDGDLVQAVRKSVNLVEGSYAMAVIAEVEPDRVVAVRKDSPLVVGVGDGEYFLASDIPAVLNRTNKFYILNDGEMVILSQDKVQILDETGREVEKELMIITWDAVAAEKGGYPHFMIKEIYEQPKALRDTLRGKIAGGKVVFPDEDIQAFFAGVQKIFIVACGTAYHAGMLGKYVIERLAKIPVEVDIASEFRYREVLWPPGSVLIVISQSGETADTLAALREAKKKGIKVLAITNVVGSSAAREADCVLFTWAGPEIAVASTKAYSTQVLLMYLLAVYLGEKRQVLSEKETEMIVDEILKIPGKVKEVLQLSDLIQGIALKHHQAMSAFFLGRGLDFAVALEGALKLKEISYIHCEAYAAGELKHGPLALIEEGVPVMALATQEELKEKMLSNIKEVKARGGTVIGVTRKGFSELASECDEVILLPEASSLLAPLLAVVPLQLLAYHMAVCRGCDVDKPRNLAKSVTVE